jgi:polysaccharide biosynthesis/export protein
MLLISSNIVFIIGVWSQHLRAQGNIFKIGRWSEVFSHEMANTGSKALVGLIFIVALVFWGGCAGNSPHTSPGNSTESMRFAYQPKSPANPENVPEYKIGYNDLLEIKFFNNPDFNETVRVRPDGRITLQRIGDIFVIGRTPAQLCSRVDSVYSRIIRSPENTVFLREFGGLNFYVLGAVSKPGSYLYEKNMNVLQAVAIAGGELQGAKLTSVFVLRKRVDGYIYVNKVNVKPGRIADILSQNIFIEPYDIIYVPKTFFGKTTDFMRRLFEGYLPPLDLYLRTVYFYNRK